MSMKEATVTLPYDQYTGTLAQIKELEDKVHKLEADRDVVVMKSDMSWGESMWGGPLVVTSYVGKDSALEFLRASAETQLRTRTEFMEKKHPFRSRIKFLFNGTAGCL